MKDSILWREAVAEGKIELRRGDIVEELKRRFGDVPRELVDLLAEIERLDKLTALFHLARECPTWISSAEDCRPVLGDRRKDVG